MKIREDKNKDKIGKERREDRKGGKGRVRTEMETIEGLHDTKKKGYGTVARTLR